MRRITYVLLLVGGAAAWTRAFWLAAADRRAAFGGIAVGVLLIVTARVLQTLARRPSAPGPGPARREPATRSAIGVLGVVVAALLNFGIALCVASTDPMSAFRSGMLGAVLLQLAVFVEVAARGQQGPREAR
jgi:cytochrome b561